VPPDGRPSIVQCDALAGEPDGIAFVRGALYFLDPPLLYRVRLPA
jgi:hypothetical protein